MSERDLARSANNTKPAKLPAINVPRGLDDQLRVVLEAMKERLEVREGSRGNPYERALTLRDVELFKSETPVAAPAAVQTATAAGITETRVKQLVDNALTIEVNTLRASIATVERAMLVLNSPPAEPPAGVTGTEARAYSGNSRFTRAQLATALASGGATILSGALAGTTVMELDPAGNYVLFKHRNANINGLGAGYTGVVRTAVGITAGGFVAGYNRQSDGAWQNSIVLDSTTGNVTILGTLKAGSVIEIGATVAGAPIGDIATNASTALATANSAKTAVATKLNSTGAAILTGPVTLNTASALTVGTPALDGTTGKNGFYIGSTGIVGTKNGYATFTLDNSGNASFSGDITGSVGSFAGNIDTGGQARFAGRNAGSGFTLSVGSTAYNFETSSLSFGSSNTSVAGSVRVGAVGYADAAISFKNVGVFGKGIGTSGKGFGVVGDGTETGGYFSTSSGYSGLSASHGQGGIAIECVGTFKFGNYTYAQPVGDTTLFMRNDGTWATPFSLSGPSTGTATANFTNTNKPGTTSSNTWLAIVQNGTTYYLPAWT